jgi:hypothetical protein
MIELILRILFRHVFWSILAPTGIIFGLNESTKGGFGSFLFFSCVGAGLLVGAVMLTNFLHMSFGIPITEGSYGWPGKLFFSISDVTIVQP